MGVRDKLPRRLRHAPPSAGPDSPAAWYRDPLDPARVRHWDGRRWRDEVRPAPAWTGITPPPARAVARRPGRGRIARWLALASLSALLAALAALSAVRSLDQVPEGERVRDERFLAAARTRCGAARTAIGAVETPRLTDPPEVKASYVTAVAARYERLADDLAAVQVDRDDRGAVSRFITALRAYADNGHRFAAALTAHGEGPQAERVRREGDDDRLALLGFAATNDLEVCVP